VNLAKAGDISGSYRGILTTRPDADDVNQKPAEAPGGRSGGAPRRNQHTSRPDTVPEV
jgi:hypothetical protein